jgi:hypothetical protein
VAITVLLVLSGDLVALKNVNPTTYSNGVYSFTGNKAYWTIFSFFLFASVCLLCI